MTGTEEKYTIEVCLSPKLYPDILTKTDFVVVLTDILRATTSIVTAFKNGVKSIIPVADLEIAKNMKSNGNLVASEQDGKKLDFADFGNSAFNFTRDAIGGKTIIYCTTNGTRALEMARSADVVVMGAFINLSATAEWLTRQKKNVVILCSGWKNKFCFEDTLYAGALSSKLLQTGNFRTIDDASCASMMLWNNVKDNISEFLPEIAHTHRLKRLGLDDVIPYSFETDTADVVPLFKGAEIFLENESK